MAFTLSYSSTSIDFANINPTINHRYSNPVITIPTPASTSLTVGGNVIVINLGFTKQTFDVSFTTKDGFGTFDFKTPGSTIYEKLVYLANIKNAKTLTLGTLAIKGHIESFSVSLVAGKKDLISGSFSFVSSKDVKME